MNELIKLNETEINNETVQTVNARELHAFLEVQTRFNDWIAARINEYGFVENQDFVSFTGNPVKIQRGIWVLDQSAHSNKQVTSFRYHESVVPVLKALIQTAL